ncbi:MAG: DHHW family protein [Clostridia bacterium]
MKVNKSGHMFLILILMFLFCVGCIFLQNFVDAWSKTVSEEESHSEKKDMYNNYGLGNNETLSEKKLVEDDRLAIYEDRIVRLANYEPNNAAYAATAANAILEKAPAIDEIYIMPVPGRVVFEKGYEDRRTKYEAFVEELGKNVSQAVTVLNPLSELEQHQEEFIYFRTDDTWTMQGAFYGTQIFRKALGYEEEENLDAYRVYMMGLFTGGLKAEAISRYSGSEWSESIAIIEDDPFFIHIKGDNPNREELTFQNSENQRETIKRNTIQMNGDGPSSVIGGSYYHSIVEGNGEGSLILLGDTTGKLLISYLSEIYEKIYVVNITRDDEFIQNLDAVCSEYGVHQVLWVQRGDKMGDRSYMNALNPFLYK